MSFAASLADPLVTPQATANVPSISVVTTLYRSSKYLDQFVTLCEQALATVGCQRYELVFVNDGSPDDSLAHVLRMRSQRPGIVVVDLSRNFGHHQAAHTGLSVATGDLIFLIDCDLEVSPMVLVDFYREMQAQACDVVYGFQETRKGGFVERTGGAVFWKLFNSMSDIPLPPNLLTERLMTRRQVQGLLELGDRNIFLAGMMHWTGFVQIGMPIAKKKREGASTYTFLRRVKLMIDAVTSFSSKPLVWLFNFGAAITTLSFAYGLYLVIDKILHPNQISLGFTTIVALIVLSLGIITMCLGVIGIYLAKVFNQVRGRPMVVIRDVYR